MKKILAVSLMAVLLMCGCENSDDAGHFDNTSDSQSEISITESNTPSEQSSSSEKISVSRSEEKKISAPEKSISFEEACQLLDSCSPNDLYLPQSAKDFEKYYDGTVTDNGKDYYSVYLYTESKNGNIFVGTNYLISCDGKKIKKKMWTNEYSSVAFSSSDTKNTEQVYGKTAVSPKEALKILGDKGSDVLRLDNDISIYTFEFDNKLKSIDSFECYKIIPKLDNGDAVEFGTPYYVNTDGSGEVYRPLDSDPNNYKQIK